MSHEGVHTHLLEARSLPTKSVVVYGDRAEVKRIVKCDLYSGRNELIIQVDSISHSISKSFALLNELKKSIFKLFSLVA